LFDAKCAFICNKHLAPPARSRYLSAAICRRGCAWGQMVLYWPSISAV
jgi:hypothetical protein